MFTSKERRFLNNRTDAMLQPLDEQWAFDLFESWGDPMKWKPGPWRSSFYHWCRHVNLPLRCDYIKRINDYFRVGDKPPKASLHFKHDKPFCYHCGEVMPTKWVRLFQAYYLGERVRHTKLFSGTQTGRF